MMNWIGELDRILATREAEVILLGRRSADELVAYAMYSNFTHASEPNGVPKPVAYRGVPVVPARGYDHLLVEVHARELPHGLAVVHRLR